jgi:hypothetical protein
MRPVRKADNLNHHPVPLSINLGTLTSWNPLGRPRPVTGLLYLNFLEPSGPLEACNGTALPYMYIRYFLAVETVGFFLKLLYVSTRLYGVIPSQLLL